LKEFAVGKNDAGQRLDRFTAKVVPLLPTSLAQKYIRIKRIKVNGKGAKRDYKLLLDDVVQMYINDEFFGVVDEKNAYLKVTNPSLDIIYEDDNIMLINKPAGMLCHNDGNFGHASVITRVQAYLYQNGEWRPKDENSFTPALCNRIDRNTSGIVIAAKNAESLRIINEKIRLLEVEKHYLAVVHGTPRPPANRLEAYIFKDTKKGRVYVTQNSQRGSKSAIMEYTTLASTGKLSLLECNLITGRTHQIRAQLASIDHPILGDGKYGNGQLNKLYDEEKQVLCSYKLKFAFTGDAGILNYLNGQTFKISNVPFREKYFNF